MATFEDSEAETLRLTKLKECIIDITNPISKRTHAAFLLRTIGSFTRYLMKLNMEEKAWAQLHQLDGMLGSQCVSDPVASSRRCCKKEGGLVLRGAVLLLERVTRWFSREPCLARDWSV
jgi:hypothetical protein